LVSAPEIVTEAFQKKFPDSGTPVVYRAPGRVNLIGEHTDYNEGFVLPIAIDLACYAAIAPAQHGKLCVYSENLGSRRAWDIESIREAKPSRDWADYVLGVAQQLERAGYPISSADMVIYSTVPVGSGLSSSAAIEVSSALALLRDREIGKTELAKLCQASERTFVGVPVGIMDQYVSVYGEPGKAVEIDCRSVTHKSVAIPEGVAIVVVNSMVKHELGSSAYRERVRECSAAVEELKRRMPHVHSLRDVRSSDLTPLTGVLLKRARHVTSENERVESFVNAAVRGDLRAMGDLFLASHRSLQLDYEVSAQELDFLVDTAMSLNGVYGARMTGGGFGGCTVNLVAPERVAEFESSISEAYECAFKIKPQVFQFVPDAGAGKIL
jgi:galactokinase